MPLNRQDRKPAPSPPKNAELISFYPGVGAGLLRLFVVGRNAGEPAPTDAPHPYPKIPFFQSHQTQTSICVYLRSSAVKISISWVGARSPISVSPNRQARKLSIAFDQ
jgi:hypothetical protein